MSDRTLFIAMIGTFLVVILASMAIVSYSNQVEAARRHEATAEAFEGGRKAARLGIPSTANPETWGVRKVAWLDGWMSTKEAEKE